MTDCPLGPILEAWAEADAPSGRFLNALYQVSESVTRGGIPEEARI